MGEQRRGRAWRAGEYLGLVSDKPKPAMGSRAWWLTVVYISACVVVGLLILRAVR